MQKNNLCPLPNKVLVYEEMDTISQSIFNSKKHLFKQNPKTKAFANKRAKQNKKYNIYNIYKNIFKNITYIKYQKYFEKNNDIFCGNYLLKKFNIEEFNKKQNLISSFYSSKDSKIIFPKREYYYRHHLEFLERPNLINIYFNKKEKEYGQKKLNEYQNQKKKENSIKKTKENNDKIFNTNVLEELENYSTTITQASNNEKIATITPFEIFRRCEENKRLFQKEKEKNTEKKNNNKNIQKDKDKDKDVKSKMTFSESCISNYSKNAIDESLIKIVKDLSEKPKKYKQDEKMLTTLFNKKKEIIQKITKFNKNLNNINHNINPKINCINKFIKKEAKKEKRTSTSNNKKNKNLIFDTLNQNLLEKNNSKRTSFSKNASSNSKKKSINNITSINLRNNKKVVLNLKKQSLKKKIHTIQFGENLKSNINNNTNKKSSHLVSISINNIDDLLNFFLTPKSEKKYKEKEQQLKKQNKKNSALTCINNVFGNSQQKNNENEEKFKKIKNKSKSPLIRLFMASNKKSEEKIINNNKKRKSVLYPEQHNSLLVKSMNFKNRNNICRNNLRQNNAITLSQNFDSTIKNIIK